MKAFVINLPRSTERRRHMASELARAGIEHRFVDGVDGMALSADERRGLVDEDVVSRAPDWLRPGIIGCALSHLETYRAILEAGEECALVLEDDVVIPPRAVPLLDSVANAMTGRDVALLYYRSVRPVRLTEQGAVVLTDGFRLLRPLEPVGATTAYVITSSACAAMLDFASPVRAGPDSWDVFLQGGALEHLRCVYPRPFGARTDFKSTIDYLGARRSPLQRLMTAVADHRIFPLYQLTALRRRRAEARLSRFTVVSDPPERV